MRIRKYRNEKRIYIVLWLLLFLVCLCWLLGETTKYNMEKQETLCWNTKKIEEQMGIENVIESKSEGKKKELVDNKNNQKKYKKIATKKDYEILERIVEAETTGGDFKSKVFVTNVILNRVKSKKFPNSVEEVVFQKVGNIYQFSPIYDKRYYTVKVQKLTKQAVKYAVENEKQRGKALYFANRNHANKRNMDWFDQNLLYLFSYGGHEFFTEKDEK